MDYGSATFELEGRKQRAVLRVHVPCTFDLMELGLQDFTGLGPREGMAFLSRKLPRVEQIPMWMASVVVPLAMLWVGANALVQAIELTEPGDPATYVHRGLYVVETNASLVDEIGIVKGTPATLTWDDPC